MIVCATFLKWTFMISFNNSDITTAANVFKSSFVILKNSVFLNARQNIGFENSVSKFLSPVHTGSLISLYSVNE